MPRGNEAGSDNRASALALIAFCVALCLTRKRPTANTHRRWIASTHHRENADFSYREVIDATKHQDDKIGRFLTAIAFITAAATAYAVQGSTLKFNYGLGGGARLPLILFALFFVLVSLAVLFLLMGLGQVLTPPGPRRRTGRPATQKSLIYFMQIADLTLDEWRTIWEDPDVLDRRIATDLVDEAHNLSTRADKKYRRTGEAQALFTLALLALALMITLSLRALGYTSTVPWDATSRSLVVGITTAFALALAYEWMRSDEWLPDKVEDPEANWKWIAFGILVAIYPASVLLPPHVFPIRVGAGVAAGSPLIASAIAGIGRGPGLRFNKTPIAFGSGTSAISALAVLRQWDLVTFSLAFFLIVLLEGPRLLSSSTQWHRRRSDLRERVRTERRIGEISADDTP